MLVNSSSGIWNISLPLSKRSTFLRVGFKCDAFNLSGASALFNVSGPATAANISYAYVSAKAGDALGPVLVTLVDKQGERCWSCSGEAVVSAVGRNGSAGAGWSGAVVVKSGLVEMTGAAVTRSGR